MIRGARITPEGTILNPAGIDIATHSRGQRSPSCTSWGDTYWISFYTGACDTTYNNIYATRVNANGVVIDTDGLPICTAEGDQLQPDVASGSSCLFVLWEDQRNYDSTGYDVYGTRVSSDGTVLDPEGVSIARLGLSEKAPNVCWGGETFFSIWEVGNYGVQCDISGVRIDTSGEISDPTPLVISAGCDAQIHGSSAWCGQSYLAVWGEGGNLRGSRVDQLGNILDSITIGVCSAPEEQSEPDLVWGVESYCAVWEDFRNSNFDIYGTRIDSNGVILNPVNLSIIEDPITDQRHPAIAFDGINYLVVWQNMLDPTGTNYRIEGIRISSTGESVDAQTFLISAGEKDSYPDVAFGDGKYLVVWQDANLYDIYGSLMDTSTMIKSQFGIRTASGLQEDPAVASDGSNFLVVWEDFGMHWPNADILATRVTSNGTVLDHSGIPVATASDPDLTPSVTFDGMNYVVAWKRSADDITELYISRVTPEGTVLDPEGILITDMSVYSSVSISFGPLNSEPPNPKGQSLVLYSKYQAEPYNSPRMFAELFWGEPEPNLPPLPFSLLLPFDQDTVMKPVFLDWEDSYDPNPLDQVIYTLYVSTSMQFAPESTLVIDDLTLSSYQISPERDSLIYWWKVRAQDEWGGMIWSDQIFSFDLENYGDANGDGIINVADVVFLINYLFREGPSPQPKAAGDVNGDCEVNLGDVIYLINYLYRGGPRPPAGCA